LFRAGQDVKTKASELAPYKSGDLRRSISTDPNSVSLVKDKISIGSNLVYARIQDQGGVIKPKRKKYLRFKIGGQWRTVKKVTIKKYKGRGYLTPAFKMVTAKLDRIFLSTFKTLFK